MKRNKNTLNKKGELVTKKRISLRGASSIIMLLVAGTVLSACGSKETVEEPKSTAEDNSAAVLADQDLVIPISEISEEAKFYPIEVDGTPLEVVAVKASDGSIRTAFNTCQVCYDSGKGYYKQQGDLLVCQNCGNQFSMDRVEVEAGGCNPWPIFDENKTVTEDSITISYDFLKESKGIFANWKGSY